MNVFCAYMCVQLCSVGLLPEINRLTDTRYILMCCFGEFRVINILSDLLYIATVRKQKLQYFGHMIRAQNPCTHIFEGQLHGRSRGRPRRRWGDNITDWTSKTLAERATIGRDRKSYRKLVCRFDRPSAMKME